MGEIRVPEFDQLHVISDLHMGGEAGRQIFTSAAELAALIRHLRDEPSNERVALLINGDSVDFFWPSRMRAISIRMARPQS